MLIKGKFLKEFPKNRSDFFGISVSKLKTFKQCKKKYKYNYILKLPRKEWEFHVFGSFLHEVLERFEKYIIGVDFNNKPISKNKLPDNLLMNKCFKEALNQGKGFDKVLWKNKITKEQKKECFKILCEFLEIRAKLKKENKLPTPIFAEKPFNINIGNDIILNGFIDLIKRDPDGMLHVADYKTTKKMTYLKNDLMQLKAYCYVMFLEDPELQRIRCSYIGLRHKFEEIKKEFNREDVMGIESEFRDFIEIIKNEKLYRPSPSPLCKYCDYLEQCQEGKEKMGVVNNFGTSDW